MDKRKNLSLSWLLRLLGSIVLFIGLFCPLSSQTLVNCVVARVDEITITWYDLKVIETFGLIGENDQNNYSVEQTLHQYLSRLLVVRLAQEQVQVAEDELEAELEKLKINLGPGQFEERCLRLGLKEADLKNYLRDKLLFDKVIGTRFNQKVYVSLKEIEEFYHQVFVEEEKKKGRTPPELTAVLDVIELRLQAEKRKRQIEEWNEELKQRAEISVYLNCLNNFKFKEVK